jgi:hypothetical protein
MTPTSSNNGRSAAGLIGVILLLVFSFCITGATSFTQGVRSLGGPTTTGGASSRWFATVYDDWQSSGLVDTTYLCEENVEVCLDEFVQSDYGRTMFGCHDEAASIGVTGEIAFIELAGPQVILSLEGKFWHRRETVLRRAAVWLNTRMPEVTDVTVEDIEELQDFTDIRDDFSGDVIARVDKRAPDFNGDRATMEYQGLDPDDRGPFPPSVFGSSRLTINPV